MDPPPTTVPVPLAPARSPLWFVGVVWLAPLLLIAAPWLPDPDSPALPLAGQVLLSLLGLGLLLGFVLVPRRLSYTLTRTGLRVGRASGTFEWPYRDLRAQATGGALGLRVGGVGLPGYHSGNYAWKGDGPRQVQALSSGIHQHALVEVRGVPHFLTPADPEGFLRALVERGVPVSGSARGWQGGVKRPSSAREKALDPTQRRA
ncbi:PH domain-containing protein [Deinococcus sp. HMF7604]|uniref:PH domain-containing protein n=1 Tax=Deinococcus betulae TaxID=2873312 RepID=UPI001CCAC4B1|nr:PH domain-containing protein [Deinococcus betulae]MBZ9751444.1 PH domain-containing protein [Deinococcus betulae]